MRYLLVLTLFISMGCGESKKFAVVEFDNGEVIMCDIVADTFRVVHVDCTTKGNKNGTP